MSTSNDHSHGGGTRTDRRAPPPHDHGHHDHDHHGHDHGHGGGHGHGPGGGHSHAPKDFGKAFAIGLVLNIGFVIAETIYGLIGNSVALLADAGHNLGDVLGLVVAWVGVIMARRKPTPRFTYGLGKSSMVAALINAMLLLVAVGIITWEAVHRILSPEPVATTTVMVVAGVGVVINGVTAWLFASGRKGDINIRAAFVHMAADAGISAGVVVAGLVIALTGMVWLDPAMSLVLNVVILWSTWGLVKSATTMILAGVPEEIDIEDVRGFLSAQEGVAEVTDLHVWPISSERTALTCHLVMPGGHPGDQALSHIAAELAQKFHIGHPTMQIDLERPRTCPLV